MRVFSFPGQVNEVAARLVAGVVATLSSLAFIWPSGWLVAAIAVGFVLRVAWGPAISPLARAAVWVAPRLGAPRWVPGRPKRFAQAIGAVVTLAGATLCAFGVVRIAQGLLGLLVVFASLEAFAGFCFGCWLFAHAQRRGWIGPDACQVCAPVAAHSPDGFPG